jgi:hypothetical protein
MKPKIEQLLCWLFRRQDYIDSSSLDFSIVYKTTWDKHDAPQRATTHLWHIRQKTTWAIQHSLVTSTVFRGTPRHAKTLIKILLFSNVYAQEGGIICRFQRQDARCRRRNENTPCTNTKLRQSSTNLPRIYYKITHRQPAVGSSSPSLLLEPLPPLASSSSTTSCGFTVMCTTFGFSR